MAGKYNFTIKQGTTHGFEIEWTLEDGSPVPLEDYTARMQLRYGDYDGPVAVELTTENGGITIDTARNRVGIHMSADQTSALDPEDCLYDLEMVKGDRVERLLQGKVKISREVTR